MIWLIVAAVTTLVIAAMHSYLGERLILPRLLRLEDLPRLRGSVDYTRQILRWAWHLTSVAWVGLAVLFVLSIYLNPEARSVVGRLVSVVLGLSGLIVFATSRGRHVAWPLFLLAAVTGWVGSTL